MDFNRIAKNVFVSKVGDVFIGGQKPTPELRGILRDQAKYLMTSQLWEIMDATITQEAAQLALIQSENFAHVETAKMLHHWGFVFRNMIYTLAKD